MQVVAPPIQPRAPTQGYLHRGACAECLARNNEVVALPRDSQLRPSMGIVESPARLKTKFETCKRHRNDKRRGMGDGDGGYSTVSEASMGFVFARKGEEHHPSCLWHEPRW